MVDMPLPNDGHGFKPAVWVRRKARNGLPVVHAPTVFVGEIATDLSAAQGSDRAHLCIAMWVVVDMVHTKQKGINRLPRECKRGGLEDGGGFHGGMRLSDLESLH